MWTPQKIKVLNSLRGPSSYFITLSLTEIYLYLLNIVIYLGHMGAVFKKKLQQFYNKAIYKAKKLGDHGWRDVNKYYSGTGSCPREQPREDHDHDDAPEGGVYPLLITGGPPMKDKLSAVVVPAGGLFASTHAMFDT